mmetsp:Transcript_12686/g.35080  ORF Transcript_12686/g.35080 Transcript_12686/m.35080 type:complete len:91 (+) Transcript_12686:876-1148(+)
MWQRRWHHQKSCEAGKRRPLPATFESSNGTALSESCVVTAFLAHPLCPLRPKALLNEHETRVLIERVGSAEKCLLLEVWMVVRCGSLLVY